MAQSMQPAALLHQQQRQQQAAYQQRTPRTKTEQLQHGLNSSARAVSLRNGLLVIFLPKTATGFAARLAPALQSANAAR